MEYQTVVGSKINLKNSLLEAYKLRPTSSSSGNHDVSFNSATTGPKSPAILSHRRTTGHNWISRATNLKSLIPISHTCKRGLWISVWLRCFNISWRSLSQLISFYLLFLNLAAEAHEYPTPFPYTCDDINNYYAHVKHLKGEALKKKLNSIIAPHRSLSYKEVWNALKILDAADVDKPEASLGIVEIYSLRVVSKHLSGKPEGWNREHLWPRSYGLTDGPSLTDLHNIRPADVNVNASRGNKYYGECKINSTKCLKPANKEAALDTETDKKTWAPPMQVRGDIARALMYMAVCYGFHQPGGSRVLHLSDSPNLENSEMGLLSTLLKWNEMDPPSREEKLRNERICRIYQYNRNPFVDHPEYVNLIWKQVVPSRASKKNISSSEREFQHGINHRKNASFSSELEK
ncbi:Extracellular ribonuclease [Quillaja saponaria]|uniref:Extracellular ribonuclease n=1 Tax=Quillaja saponaria TaxID=32244 RepID=A0AAD7QD92_QUISA|nr:Extracellular ribonuclease [Quillaja saponaria]